MATSQELELLRAVWDGERVSAGAFVGFSGAQVSQVSSGGAWLKSSSLQICVNISVAAQACCERGGPRALRSLFQGGSHWPRERSIFSMTSSW